MGTASGCSDESHHDPDGEGRPPNAVRLSDWAKVTQLRRAGMNKRELTEAWPGDNRVGSGHEAAQVKGRPWE